MGGPLVRASCEILRVWSTVYPHCHVLVDSTWVGSGDGFCNSFVADINNRRSILFL